MFGWEALLCVIYTAAAVFVGCFLMCCLGRTCENRGEISVPAWCASAFLLGQGLLANIWLLIALLGWLNASTVWLVLCACFLVGLKSVTTASLPIHERLRGLASEFRQESWPWLLVAVGVTTLLLFYVIHPQVLAMEVDGAAFYMAYPKLIAYTNSLTPLPSYEKWSMIGLQGEMHLASLMVLGAKSQARLFVWPTALACASLLLSLASLCGIGRRGQWVLLTMVYTSLTFTNYIFAGKVDLFGAAMGVAALYWICQVGSATPRATALVTGLFVGLAILGKLTLIVVLVPPLLLLFVWKSVGTSPEASTSRPKQFAWNTLLIGLGGLLVFLPHCVKNQVLFQEPLAPFMVFSPQNNMNLGEVWYSPENTRFIAATYPIALTFGQYGTMGGTLSPLLLMFLPLVFFLPRPGNWSQSLLAVLTLAGVLSLVLWIILKPSLLAPRYILPTLLILFLLPAKVVEYLSRRENLRGALRWTCIFCLLGVQTIAFRHFFVIKNAVLAGCPEPRIPMCLACEAVNREAGLDDTVLIATHYRYWLREDLLMNVEGRHIGRDLEKRPCAEERWRCIADRQFRFVMLDGVAFPKMVRLLEIDKESGTPTKTPAGIDVQTIYHENNYYVFRITDRRDVR